MSTKLRKHLRGNAVGYVAVFIALSGTAIAVDGPNPGQNTIGSEDIIGNEVKSDDIGNGRIFNLDIADEVITGGKIKNETLTSADFAIDSVGAPQLAPDSVGDSESRRFNRRFRDPNCCNRSRRARHDPRAQRDGDNHQLRCRCARRLLHPQHPDSGLRPGRGNTEHFSRLDCGGWP